MFVLLESRARDLRCRLDERRAIFVARARALATGRAAASVTGRAVLTLATCAVLLLAACDRNGAASTTDASKTEARANGESDRADGRTGAAQEEIDPGLYEADRMLKSGRFEECRRAVEAYLQRAGNAAKKAQAEFMIGLSYHSPRLYGEARAHFARAVELDPAFVPTYYFYGYCLFNLGRLDEADAVLATYLEKKPDEPDALFGRGLVALEADRVDDAERWITRAIDVTEKKRPQAKNTAKIDRDVARYQSRLADVYLRRDDLPRAKQALERAIALMPDFFESWNKLHKVLVRLGENEAAAKALAKYEELFEKRSKGGRK